MNKLIINQAAAHTITMGAFTVFTVQYVQYYFYIMYNMCHLAFPLALSFSGMHYDFSVCHIPYSVMCSLVFLYPVLCAMSFCVMGFRCCVFVCSVVCVLFILSVFVHFM
jgi:hypothetical protein